MKKAFLVLIIMIFSCDNDQVNNNIEIKLTPKIIVGDLFHEPIKILRVEENKNDFIGVPENSEYWMIYKIDNSELYNPDQLENASIKSPQYTYVLSIKKDADIIMIIDENNDKDFSNDKHVVFENLIGLSRDEITSSEQILKAPIYKINESNLKLRIFPIPNFLTSTNPKYAVANELQIASSPIGYWYGEFQLNNIFFKVGLQRRNTKDKSQILFSKVGDSFNSIFSEDYLPYNELDMVYLNGNNYLIEPLGVKDSILKLKYKDSSDFEGLHVGHQLENYSIQLIDNGNKMNISDLVQKKYVLLDFWGTWCAPCIELIPEVKKIFTNFENTQVLGIALDDNEELVKTFIDDNNIDYPNHFVSFKETDNDKNSIIQKQRISSYPYYILIDDHRRIIYRGGGKKALEKIKIVISQN